MTFSRPNQQRVKHRNPIFDPDLDITLFRMIVDSLHALNLGTLKHFSQELVWIMLWCNVWVARRGKTQDEWMELATHGLRADLSKFEDQCMKDNPSHKHTTVQKLTADHFGTPAARTLRLKAAETKVFFYFLYSKLQSVSGQLHQGTVWLGAANNMEKLLRMLETLPWKMSAQQQQDHGCICTDG